MMIYDPSPVIHRTRSKRTRHTRFPRTSQVIDFNDPQFPEHERKALLELAASPPDTDFQLICARNHLSPLDMLHKWSKLLKQFSPQQLLEIIETIKGKYKDGLGLTDIGRIIGIRRTSVRNILKGHINIERTVEHPRQKSSFKEFEFVTAFDISLCSVRPDTEPASRQQNVVLDFQMFRDLQIRRWMNEDGLLVPRSVQMLMLRNLAAGKSLPMTCLSFSVPEIRFSRMWGDLMHRYPAVPLEAGVKIVSQLMLLGYTIATISDRMECNDRVVRSIATNLGLEETDRESLIMCMLLVIQKETNLDSLAEMLNMPIAVLHCMRLRFAKVQEMSSFNKERNAWWLYQNGLETGVISNWLGFPFDLVLNGKAAE